METPADPPLVEGIKIAWRQLRDAVERMCLGMDTEAAAEANAVLPILAALTGRTPEDLLAACLRRLQKDGRLPEAPVDVVR